MKKSNSLTDQLAGQLYSKVLKQSPSTRDKEESRHMADNPLYLASDIGCPQCSPVGEASSPRGGHRDDMHIDVDPEYIDPADVGASSPIFPSGFFHSEISEEPSPIMPQNSDRSPSDSLVSAYTTPTRAHTPPTSGAGHLYVIGTPPQGFHRVDDSPFHRFIKEAHRLWVAPLLAGLPAWFDNWWKKGREGGSANKAIAAGPAIAPFEKISLTPGQSLTVKIAFAVFAFLLVAFIVYAWLEQRRRAQEGVLDISNYSPMDPKRVLLVPVKRYLTDLTEQRSARPAEPVQNRQEEEDLGFRSSSRSPSTYQYPPFNHRSRQRR